MKKEVLKVRIIDEPQTKTFYMLADKSVAIEKSFTCPHCDEKTEVTQKVSINVFDVEKEKFVTLVLPAKTAKVVLSKAYNTMLQRFARAMNTKGFGAKVKAFFTKKEITFPNPHNTFWTMKYDKDTDYKNLEVSAEVE